MPTPRIIYWWLKILRLHPGTNLRHAALYPSRRAGWRRYSKLASGSIRPSSSLVDYVSSGRGKTFRWNLILLEKTSNSEPFIPKEVYYFSRSYEVIDALKEDRLWLAYFLSVYPLDKSYTSNYSFSSMYFIILFLILLSFNTNRWV